MVKVLLHHRESVQADILDCCPDDCQATRFCGEDVDLIGALPHIAEEAFNGVGRLNVPVHSGKKIIKRQCSLFLLRQASHSFWIALAVSGFEGHQVGQGLLFCRLIPDPSEFGCHLSALSSGNGINALHREGSR